MVDNWLGKTKEEVLAETWNLCRGRRQSYKLKRQANYVRLVGEFQSIHMKRQMLMNAFIDKEQRKKSTETK